jgi:hypothetical protein
LAVALALILVVTVLLLAAWALAPRDVPWANHLERLNPGAGKQAEWMAPPGVVRGVKRDYLAAQAWLAEAACDWGMLALELERYASGTHYKRQLAALSLLVDTRGPRVASVQRAKHTLAVRHFSADGLRCLVVDRQTERSLSTLHYWSGRLIHRQRLPAAALVWQMTYDRGARRWKMERLVQTLPAPSGAVRVKLAGELPSAAGRDY